MYSTSQKLVAEFIGTFALIFFGAGSICADQISMALAGSAFLALRSRTAWPLASWFRRLATSPVGILIRR